MDKKKITAILLAGMLAVVMFYSALYITVEANHNCEGENCPICYQINACRHNLKNITPAVCAAALAAVFTYTFCRRIFSHTEVVLRCTLVSLKVKLIN